MGDRARGFGRRIPSYARTDQSLTGGTRIILLPEGGAPAAGIERPRRSGRTILFLARGEWGAQFPAEGHWPPRPCRARLRRCRGAEKRKMPRKNRRAAQSDPARSPGTPARHSAARDAADPRITAPAVSGKKGVSSLVPTIRPRAEQDQYDIRTPAAGTAPLRRRAAHTPARPGGAPPVNGG